MNGMMNENQLAIVKEYEFDNPLIQKIDSIIDDCIRDCNCKYFHTFDHVCEYDLNFTNLGNNETVIFTISDKSMGMYELNQKLAFARGNAFIFNEINNFEVKIYSNLSHINIHYYLKLGSLPLHCQFFIKVSHNRDYIQTLCTDGRNPFHFACRQWYLYYNPQCDVVYLHVLEYYYS